jgi:hypothetical protein
MRRSLTLLCSALLLALAGCGSSSSSGTNAAAPAKASPAVAAAEKPEGADFPDSEGQTLQQVADGVNQGPQVGLATSTFVPGANRVAFGMIGSDNAFLYGPTAIYFARKPSDKAQGPFIAPLDSMQVKPAFASQNASADKADIKGIYATDLRFPKAGTYAVLAVTNVSGNLQGATTQIKVARSSDIPNVGQAPPAVDTPTKASVAGNIKSIDTRVPPDDMHEADFKDVLGKKPIALLIATPALCQSRVCGPVTDIALQLEKAYGSKMTFIHQEVYVDNAVDKGLRPQLKAFHLETEPWLFVVNAQGKIAARLEGAFGLSAFQKAIQAGLQ